MEPVNLVIRKRWLRQFGQVDKWHWLD